MNRAVKKWIVLLIASSACGSGSPASPGSERQASSASPPVSSSESETPTTTGEASGRRTLTPEPEEVIAHPPPPSGSITLVTFVHTRDQELLVSQRRASLDLARRLEGLGRSVDSFEDVDSSDTFFEAEAEIPEIWRAETVVMLRYAPPREFRNGRRARGLSGIAVFSGTPSTTVFATEIDEVAGWPDAELVENLIAELVEDLPGGAS